jgi:hypothetical protein
VKLIVRHQSSEAIASPWKAAMLRTMLLRRGRALGGTHFVHLHSDQVLTMNTLTHGNWKRRLEDLGPGDSLCYSAITLWKSRHYLRLDWLEHYWGGVKGDDENQRCVAFADDGLSVFTEEFPALNNVHPARSRSRMLACNTHTRTHARTHAHTHTHTHIGAARGASAAVSAI